MKPIRFFPLVVAICWLVLPAQATLTLSPLYSFTSATTSGENPYWPLVQAGDGNFYGTTEQGGAYTYYGTVFRMTPGGTVTFPVSFNYSNGGYPFGSMMLGGDGNLYGTTAIGGASGDGTVFRMATSGALATLASFNGINGNEPTGELVQGQDGNFYGTTINGGSSGNGNVFKMTPAGVLTNLVSFNLANGGTPYAGLVQGADGNLYGRTTVNSAGGEGTIFRITTNGALTTLVLFGPNAGFSFGNLVQDADGNFYGTTSDGGTSGSGTVFKMTPDGVLTNLISFSGANGYGPYGGLTLGLDGNFYGTTEEGGANGDGTVFSITSDGTFTTLGAFAGTTGYPLAAPVQGADGNLYGTTLGGANGYGETYVLTIANQPLQITCPPRSQTAFLGQTVNLSVATLGSFPLTYQWQESGTNLADTGNLSGSSTRVLTLTNVTATNAGFYSVIVSNSFGAVTSAPAFLTVTSSVPIITVQPTNQTILSGATVMFRVGAVGNFPLFYQWQLNGTNLTDSANIIGTATTILAIANTSSANAGTYSVIVSNSLGHVSSAGAVLTVLNITLTNLYSFTGGPDGANPNALVQDTNGIFYGTTQNGGANDYGTIFQIQLIANGAPTNLYSFTGDGDGGYPMAGLVQGADGNLYGTASVGGTGDWGSVFNITPDGTFDALHSFTGVADGGFPYAELVQGVDGNFYGTTLEGGNGWGTVFRIIPGGSVSNLYSFTGGADGGSPEARLVQGVDGSLYGTTSEGGASSSGTVFKITTNGTFTNLYSFYGSSDGGFPYAGVIQAADGNLYGTTTGDGQYGYGTVFKITTNGALTTLYSFTGGSDGSFPSAELIQAGDGNLYGTTAYGGTNSDGTVFEITTNGALTTLISFNGANGANPQAVLVEGTDDNLYGTTQNGGPMDNGVIFSLSVPSLLPTLAFRTPIRLTNGTITFAWNAVDGQTYQLQSINNLASTNWVNLGSPILATNAVMTTGDVIGPDSQRFYRVVQTTP
ncbi:MAG: choice-of-anchor tandem repeat GloVer-containing protein [Verrucomicrobiia bacterium]